MTSPQSGTDYDTKASAKSNSGSPLKGIATTLALMALSGLVGYGAAWWQGSQNLSVADQARMELGKQLDASKASAIDAKTNTSLMKASTELYGIATELTDRNFGTAQKRLQATQEIFAKIDAKGSNSAKVDEFKKAIAALEVNFVTNPDDMKKRLLALAEQIKAIVP
jgi:uncharacterized protein YmfQ (DUF2313 family)